MSAGKEVQAMRPCQGGRESAKPRSCRTRSRRCKRSTRRPLRARRARIDRETAELQARAAAALSSAGSSSSALKPLEKVELDLLRRRINAKRPIAFKDGAPRRSRSPRRRTPRSTPSPRPSTPATPRPARAGLRPLAAVGRGPTRPTRTRRSPSAAPRPAGSTSPRGSPSCASAARLAPLRHPEAAAGNRPREQGPEEGRGGDAGHPRRRRG